jgi:hypothetical protein
MSDQTDGCFVPSRPFARRSTRRQAIRLIVGAIATGTASCRWFRTEPERPITSDALPSQPGARGTPTPWPTPVPTITPSTATIGSWRWLGGDGAPAARSGHWATWTGSEMLVWGFHGVPSFRPPATPVDGGRYDPVSDRWHPMTTTGQPSQVQTATFSWTGRYAVLWGMGKRRDAGTDDGTILDAGRYDPAADRWLSVSRQDAPAFAAPPAVIWTGAELLIWGAGSVGPAGGRYDPETDSWRGMSLDGAPRVTGRAHAVWTGRHLLAWSDVSVAGSITEAGRYDPTTDSWAQIGGHAVLSLGPEFATAWAGTVMLVWSVRGGRGAQYDPAADRWREMSEQDAPRRWTAAASVWTGRWLVVWGGAPVRSSTTGDAGQVSGKPAPGLPEYGAAYDPSSDSWRPVPTPGSPPFSSPGHQRHTAVWTGAEMLVWGGEGAVGNSYSHGARWSPYT